MKQIRGVSIERIDRGTDRKRDRYVVTLHYRSGGEETEFLLLLLLLLVLVLVLLLLFKVCSTERMCIGVGCLPGSAKTDSFSRSVYRGSRRSIRSKCLSR